MSRKLFSMEFINKTDVLDIQIFDHIIYYIIFKYYILYIKYYILLYIIYYILYNIQIFDLSNFHVLNGLRKLPFFCFLMHFMKIFIKDTRKISSFSDSFAIPNKKITIILGLLMYFFKLLPQMAV